MILIFFFRDNNISTTALLKKIQKNSNKNHNNEEIIIKVDVEEFSDFLASLFKESVIKRNIFPLISALIDLDHDGLIDENDFQVYINRFGYIDFKATIKNNLLNGTGDIFPKVPLSEEKIEIILRDLRQCLNRKKISFYDFIKTIDPNGVGFISVNQLGAGLDRVLTLSQPAKDGLFAYLDKQKIGLVDPKEFIKVLKRTIMDKNIVYITKNTRVNSIF